VVNAILVNVVAGDSIVVAAAGTAASIVRTSGVTQANLIVTCAPGRGMEAEVSTVVAAAGTAASIVRTSGVTEANLTVTCALGHGTEAEAALLLPVSVLLLEVLQAN